MDYFFVSILTIITSFAILKIVKKSEKKSLDKIIYRQSDMHNIMKNFFSRNIFMNEKISQMETRSEKDKVRIVAIDNMAYWVVDNVFYTTDIINNIPDMSNARPIDTSNMSKDDIDKMLFILDNLGRGKNNERGSSGN